jgi:hypothetical protein
VHIFEPCCTWDVVVVLRSEWGDVESDLVLEEGKYKGVYSEQWLGLGIILCVLR